MISYNILEDLFRRSIPLKKSYEIRVLGKDKKTASYIKELVYGVVRYKILLDHILEETTDKNINNLSRKVQNLVRMGIYEIFFMKHKDYAVLSTIVDIAKSQMKNQEKFVNWILREFLRKKDKVVIPDDDSIESLSIKYSFPEHFIEYLLEEVGLERTKQLLEFYNSKPPIYAFRIDDLEYREFKNKERLTKREYILDPIYLNIFRSLQLEESINDVLDLCAAPGGKSFLVKSFLPKSKIVAIDKDTERVEVMNRNIKRLKLKNITTFAADIFKLNLDKLFDLVILDVPCTSTGTVRKNPDVKYNYKKKIDGLVEMQKKMIEKADDFVREDGLLLYITCSIFKEENHEVVSNFLKKNKDYKLISQFFTFGDPYSGGYGALLRKRGG
ncbi:MAG: Sun protein [candidate division TA06 bacterium 32_111]|uniref:Sun protein n=1 Tax=candidate division TA06 bacterium 34_109 TaxID=1635277 RepID=A0A101I131_UNCT6|nr:MAG: Sun protein [candidate division TA06 bacterium 32_111]KUK86690.1 MAG: Sun protein [candidate division TA06 bacterium 34_109]